MIHNDDDIETMAKTIYGEARGESHEGQVAVGWVIRNRAERRGFVGPMLHMAGAVTKACRMPWQFSCWNEGDPNREKLLALQPEDYEAQRKIASAVVEGIVEDVTGGADHYHTVNIPLPFWARSYEPVKKIGAHIFYDSRIARRTFA